MKYHEYTTLLHQEFLSNFIKVKFLTLINLLIKKIGYFILIRYINMLFLKLYISFLDFLFILYCYTNTKFEQESLILAPNERLRYA